MTVLLLTAVLSAPLGFSLIPPDIDLGPPPSPAECSKDMTRFKPDPVPFEEPKRVGDWVVRPGILISECGFVTIINTAVEHKRLRLELDSLRALKRTRDAQWKLAEKSYQKTIVKLQDKLRDANAPSFWEEWDGTVMYILGVVTSGVVVWGAVEVLGAR